METQTKDQPVQETLPLWVLRAAAKRPLNLEKSGDTSGYIASEALALMGRIHNIAGVVGDYEKRRVLINQIANLVLDYALSLKPEEATEWELEDIKKYINENYKKDA